MSDLISRSALIEEMKKTETEYENAMMCPSWWNTFNIIREQPTAYSVEKIIEELELHSFELGTDTLPVHYVRLNDAIEIVKQGGDANRNVVDIHLCDTCKKTYPECDGKNVKFGCDVDTYPNTRQNKDNIFYCDGYIKREKKKTNADRVVKQGGAADDTDAMCEWKKYPFTWFTGCDGCEINHKQGDYCPRCGRKIEVVK